MKIKLIQGGIKMSRNSLMLVVIILAAYLILPANTNAQPFGYEGTQVCGMCHKIEKYGNQSKVWQESKHSQAFKALQTPAADKIATDKGLKTKAAESKECLRCHTSGYNVDKALVGAKFKVEDGVQCETCHGPGSAYKSMPVMKNKEDAVKKGLMVHADVEKFCKTCHNSESPSFKGFNFAESWKKIAHPMPKG
jgi:hypothetical protein